MNDDKYSKGFLAWFLGNHGLYAVNCDGTFEKVSEDDFWIDEFVCFLDYQLEHH